MVITPGIQCKELLFILLDKYVQFLCQISDLNLFYTRLLGIRDKSNAPEIKRIINKRIELRMLPVI